MKTSGKKNKHATGFGFNLTPAIFSVPVLVSNKSSTDILLLALQALDSRPVSEATAIHYKEQIKIELARRLAKTALKEAA